MLGALEDRVTLLLAKGRVGLVDAALVRWMYGQRACVQRLLVHVTGSIFAPLMPQEHIEEFLTALEPVDEVLGADPAETLLESLASVAVIPLPENELLNYTLALIYKRELDCDQANRLQQSTAWTIHPAHGMLGGPQIRSTGRASNKKECLTNSHRWRSCDSGMALFRDNEP